MHPLRMLGRALARYLSQPRRGEAQFTTSQPGQLAAALRTGDVLLVEGTSRFASAIKYVTQSTWSHSALYIGSSFPTSAIGTPGSDRATDAHWFVEADINAGVRVVPLSQYAELHTRICRPVGLKSAEIDVLVAYALARIGNQYDLKNVVDLARYLIQTPPVPPRYRRRLLTFASGDPTRAICSSLIAEAFQSIDYPVLPHVELARSRGASGREQVREILRIRNSRLYTPRDFDVSPYFQIIKPTLEQGFDPHGLIWAKSVPSASS